MFVSKKPESQSRFVGGSINRGWGWRRLFVGSEPVDAGLGKAVSLVRTLGHAAWRIAAILTNVYQPARVSPGFTGQDHRLHGASSVRMQPCASMHAA